ncbi:hypothetical protein EV715DRAFT_295491 [Schizophyllum commune]
MINTRTKTTTTTMTVADTAHIRDVCVPTPLDDDAPLDHDNGDADLLDDAASQDPFSGPAPYSSPYSPFTYSPSAFFDFEGDSFSLRSPICSDGRFGCAGSVGPRSGAVPPFDGAALPSGVDGPGLYQLFGFGLRPPAPITPFLAGESDTEEAGGRRRDHETGRAGEEEDGLGQALHPGDVECSETAWQDMSAFICDDALPVLVDRSPIRLIARDAGGEAALDAAWDRIRRYEASDDSDLDSALDDGDVYSSLDDSYSDDLLNDPDDSLGDDFDASLDESSFGNSLGDDSGLSALGSLPDTDRPSCAFGLWRLGLDSDCPSDLRLDEVAPVPVEEPTSPHADGQSSPSERSITFGSLPDTDGLSCTDGLWRRALGGDEGE